ncbi:MAG: molybdopterin-dependent oxidoreductase [Rhodospirillales bacterium]|nr:molybdopterin-dependent oxidoreductase [Rhodospirillales bacterium]
MTVDTDRDRGGSPAQSARVQGYCPLCISRCGIISRVEDGRLVGVETDPGHPTGGAVCVKGRAAPELVYAPERLLTPLRRTRPKGAAEPGWEPISWEEALDRITQGLRIVAANHGAEAVTFGVATPSGTAVADAFPWVHRLANAFGSPNILFATENCNWHRDFGAALTLGSGIGMPDFDHTGCLVMWGVNPAATWPAMAQRALGALRRGARLIAVDPRRTGLATRADHWLGLRPGTDGPLALALAGVLLAEGWYDRDFVRRWTNGPLLVRSGDGRLLTEADVEAGGAAGRFLAWNTGTGRAEAHRRGDGATAWALAGQYTVDTLTGPLACRPAFDLVNDQCRFWPPERAEAVTGVPAATIRDTARLIHESRPVSWYTWTGTCQHADATQVSRALAILFALTGCWDDRGGNVLFAKPPVRDVAGRDLLPTEQRRKTLGLDERPLGPPARGWITSRDLVRAVLDGSPYPVRALVSFGGNPLLTKPHVQRHKEALAALDLYVHADMVMTPTALFADIVLPVASPWEREGLQAGFMVGRDADSLIQLRPRVLEPLGNSRPDTRIIFDLAVRLGLSEHFFDGDSEAGLAHVLAPTGITAGQLRANPGGIRTGVETRLRKYEADGFATPTGLAELYSESLLKTNQPPLPVFAFPPDDPAYPLRLTSAKWPQFCHSQHRHLPSLRGRMPEPLVELAPADALARGIAEGDLVVIATPLGEAGARVKLNDGLAQGVACAQYGWWPENLNAVIDGETFDPASGSNILKSSRCDIRRA